MTDSDLSTNRPTTSFEGAQKSNMERGASPRGVKGASLMVMLLMIMSIVSLLSWRSWSGLLASGSTGLDPSESDTMQIVRFMETLGVPTWGIITLKKNIEEL